MAWVAVDDGIYLLSDDLLSDNGAPQLSRFSRDRARVVRSDGAGGLYTHDGWDILHYPPGATRPRVLFSAHGGHSAAHWNGPVRDLLLASDGSLWVVSGATLFRWQQDELTRFDYLDDPERFPSRSPMLFRVYETLQGDIHVVASNEGHLAKAGVSLRGGLLRLEDDRFVNLGQPPHWFVKAYTPVSDRLAILGTGDAFVRERQGTQGGESMMEKVVTFTKNSPSQRIGLTLRDAKEEDDDERCVVHGVAGGSVAAGVSGPRS